jgi:hypothetical protein
MMADRETLMGGSLSGIPFWAAAVLNCQRR